MLAILIAVAVPAVVALAVTNRKRIAAGALAITAGAGTILAGSPASAAPGDGTVDDVTGDNVSDIADVFADNFIEHAPTVLSLLTGVFVFFLGWRLLMVLISKINGFFRGGVSAA